MFLLALQFGLQPVLTKRFTPKTINRSTVVFSQDVVKFFMAGTVLFLTGGWAEAVAGEFSCCHSLYINSFVHFWMLSFSFCYKIQTSTFYLDSILYCIPKFDYYRI